MLGVGVDDEVSVWRVRKELARRDLEETHSVLTHEFLVGEFGEKGEVLDGHVYNFST